MVEIGLISIIMAAYNAEKTLREAVASVRAQTYENWELILVDDCSLDGTKQIAGELCGEDARIHFFENEENRGVSYTRRFAAANARGEWVAILDSDDAWTADKLEKQAKLQIETGAELLYTGSAFMDAGGERIPWILKVPETLSYRQLLKQNLLSNSSSLVRTELYREAYAYGDSMHEDFATWLRILKDGRKAYGVQEPLLIYRLSEGSKSAKKGNAAKMNWNTYRYAGLNPLAACYYMCWYMVRGVIKYAALRKARKTMQNHA